ncbi:hypothetical protein GGS20DRAFT_557106 [Poronia punctata]|nr:hypothetical protein GGS20DRAFT_557106 [Poronia punctata]
MGSRVSSGTVSFSMLLFQGLTGSIPTRRRKAATVFVSGRPKGSMKASVIGEHVFRLTFCQRLCYLAPRNVAPRNVAMYAYEYARNGISRVIYRQGIIGSSDIPNHVQSNAVGMINSDTYSAWTDFQFLLGFVSYTRIADR